MKVNLVAVQARTELNDYSSEQRFRQKMSSLMDMAVRDVAPGLPTLVSFPEAIGMYLGFVSHYWTEVENELLFEAAIAKIMRLRDIRSNSGEHLDVRADWRSTLFVENALDTEQAYTNTFASLAREHGVYLSAGSVYLPVIEDNPHLGGRFVQPGAKVHNTSYLFSPLGVCLRRTSKVNIPEGEDRLTFGASKSDLVPVETAAGSIGTLICWDGFHHTLIEHYDSFGTQVLLQPSYYSGAGKLEGLDPWAFISMIQGRENIRFGVASFLVGTVFEDKRAEGRSFIARNTGKVDTPWQEAIVAIAKHPDEETVVSAVVDL